MSDSERANRTRTLDTKQKQLDLDTQDARTAYQTDLQAAYGKVAQKVHAIMVDYVQKSGYTILLDVSNQQASQVMWIAQNPNSDITEQVIEAYNKSTPNISAPAPGQRLRQPVRSRLPQRRIRQPRHTPPLRSRPANSATLQSV